MTLAELKMLADTTAKKAQSAKTTEERAKLFDEAFAGADHNKEKSKLVAGKFIKALVMGDSATLKDLSVGVDANGGYLTPLEFAGVLVEKLYKLPVIRPYATRFPMTSDKLEVSTEASTPTVNWTNELAVITQSDPTFADVTLQANELIGISRMSRQLIADADVNTGIVEWVISRFAESIGRAEDAAFMAGTGTGQPLGIRGTAGVGTVAQVGANLDGDDIINLYYTLPIQYRANAVFLMHDNITKLVRKLKDTSGRYLWADTFEGNGLLASATNGTLVGKVVLTQNDIPVNLGGGTDESEIWFGDLSFYAIGDREQIFSEVSTQEGESFEKHRAAVKVGERVDGKATQGEAFAKMTAVK
jgi:HK97 family phage major capsid protein